MQIHDLKLEGNFLTSQKSRLLLGNNFEQSAFLVIF